MVTPVLALGPHARGYMAPIPYPPFVHVKVSQHVHTARAAWDCLPSCDAGESLRALAPSTVSRGGFDPQREGSRGPAEAK